MTTYFHHTSAASIAMQPVGTEQFPRHDELRLHSQSARNGFQNTTGAIALQASSTDGDRPVDSESRSTCTRKIQTTAHCKLEKHRHVAASTAHQHTTLVPYQHSHSHPHSLNFYTHTLFLICVSLSSLPSFLCHLFSSTLFGFFSVQLLPSFFSSACRLLSSLVRPLIHTLSPPSGARPRPPHRCCPSRQLRSYGRMITLANAWNKYFNVCLPNDHTQPHLAGRLYVPGATTALSPPTSSPWNTR